MNDQNKNIRFVFFDLETTGCSKSGSIFHDYHRIVQISAVSGEETFDAIVNPECNIPTESTAIHRVTNDMVSQENNFGKIFPLFRTFIKKQFKRNIEVILVAHNNFGFDKLILEKECSRFDMRIPHNWKFYDSLLTYRNHFPELISKRLGEIYKERFGEEIAGAHNSLADSLALKKLFENDIAEHFSIEECLQVNQQKYLSNNESVIKIRGVGKKTEEKISRFFSQNNPKIGLLRFHLIGSTYGEIEHFIRKILNCQKEEFVFSIFCEITQSPNPHLLFQSFPFIRHSFNKILPEEAVEKLIKFNIRSAEQLKRVFLFSMKENNEEWTKLLCELNVSSFTMSLIMRNI